MLLPINWLQEICRHVVTVWRGEALRLNFEPATKISPHGYHFRQRPAGEGGEACSRPETLTKRLHFSSQTCAKTAASTLYRSTKLRLTAFMTEGAGLAAVVAAAAKTRGIGCKGDLVRAFV